MKRIFVKSILAVFILTSSLMTYACYTDADCPAGKTCSASRNQCS